MGLLRAAWLWELRAPHPARARGQAPDCSHPVGHQTHLSPSFCPRMNVTELVPHSFSLLETYPELSLSKVSFLPPGEIFWAQDHLSPSKWKQLPSSGLVPQQQQLLNVFVLLDPAPPITAAGEIRNFGALACLWRSSSPCGQKCSFLPCLNIFANVLNYF